MLCLHEVKSKINRAKIFIQKTDKATQQYVFLDRSELVYFFSEYRVPLFNQLIQLLLA